MCADEVGAVPTHDMPGFSVLVHVDGRKRDEEANSPLLLVQVALEPVPRPFRLGLGSQKDHCLPSNTGSRPASLTQALHQGQLSVVPQLPISYKIGGSKSTPERIVTMSNTRKTVKTRRRTPCMCSSLLQGVEQRLVCMNRGQPPAP